MQPEITHVGKGIDPASTAEQMYEFIEDVFPICRSITGEGFRETMRAIGSHIPLEISEVPTGTQVLDWTVPREWNIRDAYIKDPDGHRVVDFRSSNLHVVSYSIPMAGQMSLSELSDHLHSIPEHPDWIPYRTSYYKESWGFCLSHAQLVALPDERYEVCIDSSLEEGSLTLGQCYIPGRKRDEILISTHACHPSLGNDNLSGVALSTFLAKHLLELRLDYSYRFLFIPGTIGSITWLALNEDKIGSIKHGLVVTCVGDRGRATYKKTRRGNAEIDKAVTHVLAHTGNDYAIVDFTPYGYDERQYSSPGFDLPVGSLMRSPNGTYPEYHTSADDLGFVATESLADSLSNYLGVLDVLENNARYRNLSPKGEPQLGKRGLYPSMGGKQAQVEQMSLLWVLNLSDGEHSLLDIAERSGLHFGVIKQAAAALIEHDLLAPA